MNAYFSVMSMYAIHFVMRFHSSCSWSRKHRIIIECSLVCSKAHAFPRDCMEATRHRMPVPLLLRRTLQNHILKSRLTPRRVQLPFLEPVPGKLEEPARKRKYHDMENEEKKGEREQDIIDMREAMKIRRQARTNWQETAGK